MIMFTTLAFLVAAGQVATALDGPFSYSPRATTSDDNLATITTLVDGHLPTCFTGHPTNPCPTNGPEGKRDLASDLGTSDLTGGLNEAARVVSLGGISITASQGEQSLPTEAPDLAARDAPSKVSNGDYIPEPNEWAIPQDFTFTDSTKHNTTETASTACTLTTSFSEKSNVASPTSTQNSSSSQLSGTIGTLLSQAMFPGKMRTPATTNASPFAANTMSPHDQHMAQWDPKIYARASVIDSQVSAPAVTPAPSAGTPQLVAIPMSESPNTTANGKVQAFVHTINTEETAPSQHTVSSDTTLPAVASATPLAKESDKATADPLTATSMAEAQKNAPVSEDTYASEMDADKIVKDMKLGQYVGSPVATYSSSTQTQEARASSSSANQYDSKPLDDVKPTTMIASYRPVTSTKVEPTATPSAHKMAHLHPSARRFIS